MNLAQLWCSAIKIMSATCAPMTEKNSSFRVNGSISQFMTSLLDIITVYKEATYPSMCLNLISDMDATELFKVFYMKFKKEIKSWARKHCMDKGKSLAKLFVAFGQVNALFLDELLPHKTDELIYGICSNFRRININVLNKLMK